MKKFIYLLAATALTATMAGCSDDTFGFDGEGTVMLKATINTDVKVVSRAESQELYDLYAASTNIWISKTGSADPSKDGLVRKYVGFDNVPAEGIKLLAGHYVAEAWVGDSVPASFDKKYFKGYQPFDVTNGSTEEINLVCKVANTVVSVKYDDDVDLVLRDYTFKVAHTRGNLTFDGRDDRKGYFMMPNGVKDLTYELKGTRKDNNQEYIMTGTIPNVEPTTEYALTVKVKENNATVGGGFLTIEIDTTPLDEIGDEIVITTAPELFGYRNGERFDLDKAVHAEAGSVGRTSVWVIASSALESVQLSSPELNSLIGANAIDLRGASSTWMDALQAAGITVNYEYDSTKDISRMKISLETKVTNTFANGDYAFDITATDANGKSSSATLKFNISSDPIVLPESGQSLSDVWTNTATLRASIVDESKASNPRFDYRPLGETEWQSVSATPVSRAAVEVSATLTGLKAGTKYQYRVACDGFEGNIATFTTGAAPQLPNAGFEEWNLSKTPYLIYSAGGSMFWDSGNHGSATMSKNVTEPDDAVKHSGTYSIALKSQFVGVGVIGKFAAGNVFIGKYLDTEGTDGILGFGRPFNGRPKALRGWIKYKPVAVSHVGGSQPGLAKGDMDEGIIYFALLDETVKDYKGEKYPVIIKTKTKELFDKNGSNVIAYAEKIFTATSGDGMVQFEIPIEYLKTDKIPSYILCTCAASRGGDYFTGGSGSTMWIDDLELVY